MMRSRSRWKSLRGPRRSAGVELEADAAGLAPPNSRPPWAHGSAANRALGGTRGTLTLTPSRLGQRAIRLNGNRSATAKDMVETTQFLGGGLKSYVREKMGPPTGCNGGGGKRSQELYSSRVIGATRRPKTCLFLLDDKLSSATKLSFPILHPTTAKLAISCGKQATK